VQFRLRTRHANSFTGVPGEWFTQATPPIPPDSDQHNRTNVFLASTDLNIAGSDAGTTTCMATNTSFED